MRVCMIGDVVGAAGCDCLRRHLPELKKLYKIDFVIVNGENSAEGNGILPSSAEDIFTSGADVITTGNHVFRRREIYEYLEEQPFVLRPVNYPQAPGHGYCVVDAGKYQIAVVSLMGTVYMDSLDNPFYAIKRPWVIILTAGLPQWLVLIPMYKPQTKKFCRKAPPI